MTDLERRALARIAETSSEAALRQTMRNAKAVAPTVYRAAFVRLVELCVAREMLPADDDLAVARACWEMVHTIEQVRREAGRAVWRMNRLRPKIAREGTAAALDYCAANETEGFREVLDYGLPEYTAEAIVLRFPAVFTEQTRRVARERLAAAGIDPALYERHG